MLVHRKANLLLLTAVTCSAAWGQTEAKIGASQARIAQDLTMIHAAEQQHLAPSREGAIWAQLALEYQAAASFAKAEDAYNHALPLLKTAPSSRADYATTLDNLSTLYMSYGRVDDAESATNQAFAERQKLGNLSDIGLSQIHLAAIALVRHQFKKAEQLSERGIQSLQSSAHPSRAGLLSAYITLTYARCSRGRCGDGLVSAEQALAFAKETSEPESAAVGFALETLGFAQWKSGSPQDGEKSMLQGLQILRSRLAVDDPRLAGAMLQYRTYLLQANRQAEADDIQQQLKGMMRQAGISCSGCAISVHSLSSGLR